MADARRPHPSIAAPLLLLNFAVALSLSAWATLRVILSAGGARRAGLLRVPFAPMSELGAALLGSLITLTPGTTTLDVDTERGELLLHVLDLEDEASVTRDIRRWFEAPLLSLFGRSGS